MNLKQKAIVAIRWTTISMLLRCIVHFVQLVILARILNAEDFGLFAMLTVILSFVNLFSDCGLSSAYVQCQEITDKQRSSLYWLNVGLGLFLTVILMCLSPLFALYFNEPRLTKMLFFSSISFFFVSLTQQVRVVAEKRLDFKKIGKIDICCVFVQFFITILCAYSGLKVYSLIVSAVLTSVIKTVLTWAMLSNGWVPLRIICLDEIQELVSFGKILVINNFINHINSNIDIFLTGRLLPIDNFGQYSISRNLTFQIQSVFNPIITRVAFPLIANIQNEKNKIRTIYLQILNLTASMNAPIYVGLFFYANEIVLIVLGSSWTKSIILLKLLSLWAAVRSMGNPVGSLLLGLGEVKLSLKWNICMLIFTPLGVFYGIQFQAYGVAWAMLLMVLLTFIPLWYFLIRSLASISLTNYISALLGPYVISFLSIYPTYLLTRILNNSLLRLILGVSFSVVLYFLFSFIFNKKFIKNIVLLLKIKTLKKKL